MDWMFQSPSLRGSGRFTEGKARLGLSIRVSIPFIAGQWSLQAVGFTRARRPGVVFQSPSLRGSGRFLLKRLRNVVENDRVSIPFIAGQWSLRG